MSDRANPNGEQEDEEREYYEEIEEDENGNQIAQQDIDYEVSDEEIDVDVLADQIARAMEGDADDADLAEMEEAEGESEPVVDLSAAQFYGHNVTPEHARDSMYCVALSPVNPHMVLSGGGDDKVCLWSALNPGDSKELIKHADSVVAVAFSSDGTIAASGGMDGVVNLFSTSTGAFLRKLEGPGEEIEWIAFHPQGNVLAAGSADGTAWMWDCDTGEAMNTFFGHSAGLSCGSFTPNGRRLVTGSFDGTLKVWDPRSGQCAHSFEGHNWHEQGAGVLCVAFQPGEPCVATGSQDGTVCLARLDTFKVLMKLHHAVNVPDEDRRHDQAEEEEESPEIYSVEAVAFCPVNASWLVSAGVDGRVVVWDLLTRSARSVLGHNLGLDGAIRLAWVRKSHIVVVAHADGVIRRWDVRAGTAIEPDLTGHKAAILDMVGSSDGGFVVSCGDDGSCRVFNL